MTWQGVLVSVRADAAVGGGAGRGAASSRRAKRRRSTPRADPSALKVRSSKSRAPSWL